MSSCRNAPVPLGTPKTDSQATVDRVHRAVLRDKFKTLMTLLKSGVPVDIANKLDQSPLFCAAYLGRLEMCIFLLRWNADPNRRCVSIGCTPVHAACYAGNPRVLAALISAGGDLRLHDQHGRLPREWAILQTNPERRISVLNAIDNYYDAAKHEDSVNPDESRQDLIDQKWYDSVPLKLPSRIRKTFTSNPCCFSEHTDVAGPLIRVQATGFGKFFYANGKSAACFGVVPMISAFTLVDFDSLTSDDLVHFPSRPISYRCGTVSDMTPRLWLHSPVTVRKARESCYADVIIQEIQRISQVRHPGILTLLGVCADADVFMPMPVYEPVQQGSFYHRLHIMGANMSVFRKLQILQQSCEAIQFLHDQGFLHCSLTSHAIHLVSPQRAKLGCFETLSAKDDDLRKVYRMAPTCHWESCTPWMAPELLRGEWPTCKSDIYAFCCIIWEAFLVKVPWYPKSSSQISAQWDNDLKYAPSLNTKYGLPTHISSVLKIGLKPDVHDRQDIDLQEIMLMLRLQTADSLRAKQKDSLNFDSLNLKEEKTKRPLSFDEVKMRMKKQNSTSFVPDVQSRKNLTKYEEAQISMSDSETESDSDICQTIKIDTHIYRNPPGNAVYGARMDDAITRNPIDGNQIGMSLSTDRKDARSDVDYRDFDAGKNSDEAEDSRASMLPPYQTFDEGQDCHAPIGEPLKTRPRKFRWFFLNPIDPGIKPASHQTGKDDMQAMGSYLQPNSYYTPSKWVANDVIPSLSQGATRNYYANFPSELREAVALPPKLHEGLSDFERPQWHGPRLDDSSGAIPKRKPKKQTRFSLSRKSNTAVKKITFAKEPMPSCSTPKKGTKKTSFLACSSPWTSPHLIDLDNSSLTTEISIIENGAKSGVPFANIRTGFVAATIAKLTGKSAESLRNSNTQKRGSPVLDSLKDDISGDEFDGLVDDMVGKFETLGKHE